MSISTLSNNSKIMNALAIDFVDKYSGSFGNVINKISQNLQGASFDETGEYTYTITLSNNTTSTNGRIILSGFMKATNANYADSITLFVRLNGSDGIVTLTEKATQIASNVMPIYLICDTNDVAIGHNTLEIFFSTNGGASNQSYLIQNLVLQFDVINGD